MKKLFAVLMFALMLLPALAFADAVAVAPGAGIPILSQISGYLAQAMSGPVAMILAFVYEGVAKLWPTANPQGLLLHADVLLKKAGAILSRIGDVLVKLDGVISSIIPQNIAAPAVSAPPKV